MACAAGVAGVPAKPVGIYDADTGKLVRETDHSFAIMPSALAWSANGKQIAAIDLQAKFQVWNASTGKALWCNKLGEVEVPHAPITAFRFAQNDQLLALACKPTFFILNQGDKQSKTWSVELWEVAAGRRKTTWGVDETKRQLLRALGDGYTFHHVALSPSGILMAWLAAPAVEDKEGNCAIFIYDTGNGKPVHTLKNLPRAERADLPDEGETLLLRPRGGVKELTAVLTGQAAGIGIPDGRVTFHCDYRLAPEKYVNPYSDPGASKHAAIDVAAATRFRDGLVIIDEMGITRWDRKTGQKRDAYNEPFASVAVVADGRRLVIRDGRRIGITDGALASLKRPGAYARAPRCASCRMAVCWARMPNGGAMALCMFGNHANELCWKPFGSTPGRRFLPRRSTPGVRPSSTQPREASRRSI